MKTKFITSVMAIIFASASLFAADSAATVELVNQKGSSIYKVVYKAPGTGKAVLKISGTDGLVFSEIVTYTNGFAYPIDFKDMAEGEYTVEVLGKDTRFKQTVDLKSNRPVAYVRTREQSNKKELLTIVSEVPTDFTIRVYDKWNKEIFTKVEAVNTSYGVLLNVDNLETGYSIEVTEAGGNVKVIRK
jgi:hypothetical protein